jgi:hypothetical protein
MTCAARGRQVVIVRRTVSTTDGRGPSPAIAELKQLTGPASASHHAEVCNSSWAPAEAAARQKESFDKRGRRLTDTHNAA